MTVLNIDLREALAHLLAALDKAKPYIVRTIENDPDAPWMKGQPQEVGIVLLKSIEKARAALAQKDDSV